MLRFHTFQSTTRDMMSSPEGSIACSSEVRHPREKEKGHKQCTGERERASSQVRLRLVTIWIQENDKDHKNNMGRGEMPAILITIVYYPIQGSSRSVWELTPGGAHVCPKCASEFSSYTNMCEHFRSCVERVFDHTDNKWKHKCEKCPYMNTKRKIVTRHMAKHHRV